MRAAPGAVKLDELKAKPVGSYAIQVTDEGGSLLVYVASPTEKPSAAAIVQAYADAKQPAQADGNLVRMTLQLAKFQDGHLHGRPLIRTLMQRLTAAAGAHDFGGQLNAVLRSRQGCKGGDAARRRAE